MVYLRRLLIVTLGTALMPVLPLAFAHADVCQGTQVTSGQSIQSALNSTAAGGTVCVAAGTYRLVSPLTPQNGQRLLGAPGADLNGSKVLSGFVVAGADYRANGYPTTAQQRHGECSIAGCTSTQGVFLDGQPLKRVLSRDALAPGRFYQNSTNGRVFLRDNPAGLLAEEAVAPGIIFSGATGVTVNGFIVEKAANPAQTGAIHTSNPNAGWTISHNVVRFNHGDGIATESSTVSHNFVHHQGQQGVSSVDYDGGTGAVWEANEVSFNNTAGYDPGWEAGGSKWGFTVNTTVRGNYFHDNYGPGIWFDSGNTGTLIDGNVSVRNQLKGIFIEVNADARVVNNQVLDNTTGTSGFYNGAQIIVSATPNVEVSGNRVRGGNGIGAVQQDRSGDLACGGPCLVKNLTVHDNSVSITAADGSASGAVTDTGDSSVFTSRNNRWNGNAYHLPYLTGRWFDWANRALTIPEWQGYGMETAGTLDTAIDNSPARIPPVGP